MARYENLNVNKMTVDSLHMRKGAKAAELPRNAIGLVVFADVGVATETHVIGDVTYTWIADPSGETSTATAVAVDIGADAAGCATNLAAAINASGTAGTTYGLATVKNPKVYAVIATTSTAGDTVMVIARNSGASGNAIVFTETGTNTTHTKRDGSTAITTLYNGSNGDGKGGLVDPSNYTNVTFRNGNLVNQLKNGGAATGSTGDENICFYKGEVFENHILGAGQTIINPVPVESGLDITGDAADNEGREISQGITEFDKHGLVVGMSPYVMRLRVKFTVADVSDTDQLLVGWRKAEAYQADWNDYDELIAFNVNAGDIYGALIKNNAATDEDDLGDNWGDNETHTLEVRVHPNGAVTLLIDDAAPTTAHAGTLLFDGNEVVIPFLYHLHAASSASGIVIQEWECGPLL